MNTTTSLGTRRRTTSKSNPFAPGATIAGKRVERWCPFPSASPFTQHLDLPLRWSKARHGILTNDLFDGSLSDEQIAAVFGVMALADRHTFQALTKRPERMLRWFEWIATHPLYRARAVDDRGAAHSCIVLLRCLGPQVIDSPLSTAHVIAKHNPNPDASILRRWPLPNVLLGVSVEDQATADERIPLLLQTPAALRFVSQEPQLAPVDLLHVHVEGGYVDALRGARPAYPPIDWLIVGGESGPGARPFDVAWARSTVEQCREAGVACFVKQLGSNVRDRNDSTFDGEGPKAWPREIEERDGIEFLEEGFQGQPVRLHLRHRKGGDWSEWPEDLRVREFPRANALPSQEGSEP
jgi:protein gp37